MSRREDGQHERAGRRPLPLGSEDERYLHDVLDALPDVFCAVDLTAGALVGWNERLESVTGHDAETLDGMAPTELVPDGDEDAVAAAIDDVLGSEAPGPLEVSLVTADGETVPHELVGDLEPVALGRVATAAWEGAATPDASLELAGDLPVVEADPDRLVRLFENLFRNSVEHAGPGVTVSVGRLADDRGFYVADDGPGIPEAEREQAFRPGYSTAESSGQGLDIVAQLATAHGWEVAAREGDEGGVPASESSEGSSERSSGGARFEFTVE